jgi:hypothetical protein
MLRHLPRTCYNPTQPSRHIFTTSSRYIYSSSLRRFPQVFSNAPRNRIPKTAPSFREEVAHATVPKSFSEQVRYPGIRNQILVILPCLCLRDVLYPHIFQVLCSRLLLCVFRRSEVYKLRHRVLGTEAGGRFRLCWILEYCSANI